MSGDSQSCSAISTIIFHKCHNIFDRHREFLGSGQYHRRRKWSFGIMKQFVIYFTFYLYICKGFFWGVWRCGGCGRNDIFGQISSIQRRDSKSSPQKPGSQNIAWQHIFTFTKQQRQRAFNFFKDSHKHILKNRSFVEKFISSGERFLHIGECLFIESDG